MTALLVGRPRRKRPTDRVNYKLDSDLRAILSAIAERKGRNEGSMVEQMILFYESVEQLNREGLPITLDSINAKSNEIWDQLAQKDQGDEESRHE